MHRFLPAGSISETPGLALRVMLSSALLWIFPVMFPVCLHFWGWKVAVLHTILTTIWVVSLSEILLVRFAKLPFTCRYPAFRHSAVVVVLAYGLGYFAFAGGNFGTGGGSDRKSDGCFAAAGAQSGYLLFRPPHPPAADAFR